MKKILWVTPDYFADCDIPLVPQLANYFSITWVVLLPPVARYKETDYIEIGSSNPNLNIQIIRLQRERHVSNVLKYYKVVRIKSIIKPDVIYLNASPASPWQIPMICLFPKNKTIVTAHQGKIHEGMKNNMYTRAMRALMYGRYYLVHMFSKSQAVLFKESYPNSHVFLSHLGLKNFGEPTNRRPNNGDIRFLSFGIINYTKNIDLLIQAACILYERGKRGFKVSINGMCSNWEWYEKQIKYPEIFETDIRMIANEEIPNLFNGSHYLVQPYRVVSQSGPTKVAFQYNLPVLASNLPGFTDEIVEGVNGYTFKKGDAMSLADKMQMLIERHTDYNNLLKKEEEYTKRCYSYEALVGQYVDMFNEIIVNNG